ncbi:K+ channel tetramerization domain-containing protein [Naegleria gruberi]|uniref:K+ channel tetramerization domain-containing protein n=1 Tax=Naegleria gruberi TaxID=5762 RepID=D2W2J3_NAEGR|nr:K+ channel tetramerization domain-containing protein [Naegleria gruberi]EFC36754.1 K+ channel tetramerization domain-containing protein [Naegleria gruberi]|eukprot:XP_002669498.1 K+ channel tetramerization domain-containing protein [Naegleria gruberi strain NEG-M]
MSNNSSYESLKNQLDQGAKQLLAAQLSIEERISHLLKLEQEWSEKEKLMEENANKAKSTIKLDVGGKIFKTSRETLLSKKDTFFYAMISSGKWLPDEDGSYFIDRNPKLFHYVLDFMRYGKVDLSALDKSKRDLLREEADYYLISEMFSDESADQERNGIADTFDMNLKGPYTDLSDNNKTATASQTGNTCALGSDGISSGKRTWKLRMNHFASTSHWIMVGVASKPLTDYQNSFEQPNNFGISSRNQKFTDCSSSSTTASNDWAVGHIIQVDLDCSKNTLKITNLNTGKYEEWQNLPPNTYYLHLNVFNANDSVTILDQ